jgi:hypothetical protein
MKIYEVGVFEKYEAGFQTLYRTLDKGKASCINEKARQYLSMMPKINLDSIDSDFEKHVEVCNSIDQEFKKSAGVNFSLSGYSGDLYQIQIRSFDLD